MQPAAEVSNKHTDRKSALSRLNVVEQKYKVAEILKYDYMKLDFSTVLEQMYCVTFHQWQV